MHASETLVGRAGGSRRCFFNYLSNSWRESHSVTWSSDMCQVKVKNRRNQSSTTRLIYRSMFPVRKQKRSSISLDSDEMPLKVRLLLGVRQMLFENYPLPLDGKMKEVSRSCLTFYNVFIFSILKQKYAEYVMTKDSYEEVSQDSPMFSIDCEMCMTDTGTLELTRICVVDAELKVVFHSLVKPHNQITNYLTKFSGITPDMLVDVETRLSDVQDKLREIIPANAILIGQSLNSDLHALKMMHPYVIDTSVIFNITGMGLNSVFYRIISDNSHFQVKGEGKRSCLCLPLSFSGRRSKPRWMNLERLSRVTILLKMPKLPCKSHSLWRVLDTLFMVLLWRKLVNLKLEKGYEFGDVILNGSVPNLVDKTNPKKAEDNTVLGTSVARLLQTNNKSMKIVCQNEVRHDYSVIPSVDQYLIEAKTAKEALQLTTDVSACWRQLTRTFVLMTLIDSPPGSVQQQPEHLSHQCAGSQGGWQPGLWELEEGSKDDQETVEAHLGERPLSHCLGWQKIWRKCLCWNLVEKGHKATIKIGLHVLNLWLFFFYIFEDLFILVKKVLRLFAFVDLGDGQHHIIDFCPSPSRESKKKVFVRSHFRYSLQISYFICGYNYQCGCAFLRSLTSSSASTYYALPSGRHSRSASSQECSRYKSSARWPWSGSEIWISGLQKDTRWPWSV